MASDSKFKIYTRSGDSGTSSLYTGERRPKEDQAFAALGDVDELNSALGLAREFCCPDAHGALPQQLALLQSRLLDVGSAVATPLGAAPASKRAHVQFGGDAALQLEAWIDAMDEELPPLRNFILPSGGRAAAALHMARSICRRAERSVVPLVRAGDTEAAVGVFVNRLSDYLFQAARWAALKEGKEETTYKKGAPESAAPAASGEPADAAGRSTDPGGAGA